MGAEGSHTPRQPAHFTLEQPPDQPTLTAAANRCSAAPSNNKVQMKGGGQATHECMHGGWITRMKAAPRLPAAPGGRPRRRSGGHGARAAPRRLGRAGRLLRWAAGLEASAELDTDQRHIQVLCKRQEAGWGGWWGGWYNIFVYAGCLAGREEGWMQGSSRGGAPAGSAASGTPNGAAVHRGALQPARRRRQRLGEGAAEAGYQRRPLTSLLVLTSHHHIKVVPAAGGKRGDGRRDASSEEDDSAGQAGYQPPCSNGTGTQTDSPVGGHLHLGHAHHQVAHLLVQPLLEGRGGMEGGGRQGGERGGKEGTRARVRRDGGERKGGKQAGDRGVGRTGRKPAPSPSATPAHPLPPAAGSTSTPPAHQHTASTPPAHRRRTTSTPPPPAHLVLGEDVVVEQ